MSCACVLSVYEYVCGCLCLCLSVCLRACVRACVRARPRKLVWLNCTVVCPYNFCARNAACNAAGVLRLQHCAQQLHRMSATYNITRTWARMNWRVHDGMCMRVVCACCVCVLCMRVVCACCFLSFYPISFTYEHQTPWLHDHLTYRQLSIELPMFSLCRVYLFSESLPIFVILNEVGHFKSKHSTQHWPIALMTKLVPATNKRNNANFRRTSKGDTWAVFQEGGAAIWKEWENTRRC